MPGEIFVSFIGEMISHHLHHITRSTVRLYQILYYKIPRLFSRCTNSHNKSITMVARCMCDAMTCQGRDSIGETI